MGANTDREELIAALSAEVTDRRVLDAIASVPRELFVPEDQRPYAWENRPLPIGQGQTISQPLVVATMCEMLAPGPDDLVLDIGGGSGYHAAVLARLARRVISIERHPELVGQARQSLEDAGVENVEMICGDGSHGYPAEAPFDVINVAAAARGEVPAALKEQLAEGGRMIVPVGRWRQWLELWRRKDGELSRERVVAVAFVPLVEDG
ncbi:MAG: protein-L-isoaspartate(D-aspartate) O-methyltransferase [Solirubrobacterales bacterium]|nr:protein-L-isoaspartate(D-aspartate) O-methyltransferase [Solirubrobacterales bacterium]MCB0860884.1 protein-L-isoaspartate(D-aspartate) O-methyltransferase [Solirubrobacterales bacterium]HRV60179.1 protein-L-isoaspartate(D-aspartate) O-methyltransferase [Solirubrobacterales bacterium]